MINSSKPGTSYNSAVKKVENEPVKQSMISINNQEESSSGEDEKPIVILSENEEEFGIPTMRGESEFYDNNDDNDDSSDGGGI